MAIRERKKAKLQLDRSSERPSHFMRLWPRVNPSHMITSRIQARETSTVLLEYFSIP
jgi:hypothetical protein